LPEDSSNFIERVKLIDITSDLLPITFITDLELAELRKIEQIIVKKIPIAELPDDLIIEAEKSKSNSETKLVKKAKSAMPVAGEAFHQKKLENSKTYNYSSGVKAKMNKKKKHG
jgi:ATP-dependent RNA helicase RhlE